MARILTLTLNPALDLAIRIGPIRLGEVNRTESTQLDAAGKGINVARVLRDLGHDVTVSGLLGADNETAFVRAFARYGCTMRSSGYRASRASTRRSPNRTGASPTSMGRVRSFPLMHWTCCPCAWGRCCPESMRS